MKAHLVGLVGLGLMGTAMAGPVTFSGSSGNFAASARFENVGGGVLKVTLTNTSATDVANFGQLLTSVFFDIPSAGALTPVSALLPVGSNVYQFNGTGSNGTNPVNPAITNVGGEWAYRSGIAGPHGATEGISSVGLSLFGSFNFNGPELNGNAAVAGDEYGITSAGDNISTGNNPLKGSRIIKNSVDFRLSGIPLNFDPSAAGAFGRSLSFQYGSELSHTNIELHPPQVLVPLPTGACAGMAMLAGLLGLNGLRRRVR